MRVFLLLVFVVAVSGLSLSRHALSAFSHPRSSHRTSHKANHVGVNAPRSLEEVDPDEAITLLSRMPPAMVKKNLDMGSGPAILYFSELKSVPLTDIIEGCNEIPSDERDQVLAGINAILGVIRGTPHTSYVGVLSAIAMTLANSPPPTITVDPYLVDEETPGRFPFPSALVPVSPGPMRIPEATLFWEKGHFTNERGQSNRPPTLGARSSAPNTPQRPREPASKPQNQDLGAWLLSRLGCGARK